ncbi:MAG: GNAT family N-acetyltransferase [Capsulimonas sp.]|uniref:GNAT family N-acetyltransferase n=1 Tax=Capsulimonas sp. TaxID=2494211 RepID=UPI0032654AEC
MKQSLILAQRPATPDDEAFLFEVYASTRANEMSAVTWDAEQKVDFLHTEFLEQNTFFQARFPDGQYDVLMQDGVRAGRLYVDYREDELWILDISLLPKYCGKGIGSRVIGALMRHAREEDLVIRLHVEHFNRAYHLWRRLGFSQIQNDGMYLLMEWNPNNVYA